MMKKKLRKRFLSFCLVFLLCGALCGCSADTQNGENAGAAEQKTLAEVVSLDFDGDSWTVEMLAQGRLLARNIGYADDGTMLWYIDYEYGENGQISKAWVYDAEKNLVNPKPEEEQK